MVGCAQNPKQKEVNQQFQTWVSLNSVTKFSKNWAIAADVHLRANEFFQDTNFFLIRGGLSYIPNAKFAVTAGYAHLWLAPKNSSWTDFSDENRAYQQVQKNSKSGKITIIQRIRNEQRWQEIVLNNVATDKYKFSNRVRYLLGATIPIFKKKTAPLLVISDEFMLQFGKDIVYNTFDQNRIFIGIKQAINPKLSFDFGYMNLYQQKSSGYQYDMNHTLRLFFYLNSNVTHE
jgi:hypothetical protein